MVFHHTSVMPKEVLEYLKPQPGGVYVDGTIGGAGHASLICERIHPKGIFIGMDHDWDAVAHAEKKLASYKSMIRIFHANFSQLPEILTQLKIRAVDGILVDLGLSLHQIENSGRGFSFQREEPLDMRMDTDSTVTAADLINGHSENQLSKIFSTYGEERWAKRISRKVAQQRQIAPFTTSLQLADIVKAAIPAKAAQEQRIHPATRVFMALRMAVNRELEKLEHFLKKIDQMLNPGGRLCTISFHSLEDRLIKHRLRDFMISCDCPPSFPVCTCNRIKTMRCLTRKVVRPTETEVSKNPMARSAKLRAYEKL